MSRLVMDGGNGWQQLARWQDLRLCLPFWPESFGESRLQLPANSNKTNGGKTGQGGKDHTTADGISHRNGSTGP